MARTIPVKTAKKKAWAAFSKYIRVRDCLRTTNSPNMGRCISCDILLPIEKTQAGHLVGGRTNAILFDERGVFLQCYACNMYKQGNTKGYINSLRKLIGFDETEKLWEELHRLKNEARQFKAHELSDIEKKYKEKTKKLLESS